MRICFFDRTGWVLGLVLAAAILGQAAEPMIADWGKAVDVNRSPKLMTYKSMVTDDQGQTSLSVASAAIPGAKTNSTTACVAFTWLPFQPPADSAGISFEVKGNGSPHFGSVFAGPDDALLNGFEAFFPLDGTHWQTITLRWREFVKNDLPWDANAKFLVKTLAPLPGDIRAIGFGRGNCNHKFYTPAFGFAIRNLRTVTTLPEQPVPAYSKGLSRTVDLIRQGKPLNILMLGDSITDLGAEKSHGFHGAQLLQQKWHLPAGNVANAGIGGQTARFGTIGLPRALRLMPQPDLVCIMYGANDCKAANPPYEKSGFNEAVFAENLGMLIDQVRRLTNGQADIIVLSGVPRLDKRGGTTTGAIEKIVGAIAGTAGKKETAFCDTFPAYLQLSAADKQAYYMDTIHQSQAGLKFLGQLLFKTIDEAATKEIPANTRNSNPKPADMGK